MFTKLNFPQYLAEKINQELHEFNSTKSFQYKSYRVYLIIHQNYAMMESF